MRCISCATTCTVAGAPQSSQWVFFGALFVFFISPLLAVALKGLCRYGLSRSLRCWVDSSCGWWMVPPSRTQLVIASLSSDAPNIHHHDTNVKTYICILHTFIMRYSHSTGTTVAIARYQ